LFCSHLFSILSWSVVFCFSGLRFFAHVTRRCTMPQSNDIGSFSLPNATSRLPSSISTSQSYPLSLSTQQSSSVEASTPHSPPQLPVSVSLEPQEPATSSDEPQSEVDVALRVLSSSSSLQTESARVMPLPGYARSSSLHTDSSTLQVR